MQTFQKYPYELRSAEAEAIRTRRTIAVPEPPRPGDPAANTPAPMDEAGMPADTVGLALSGGGVRSATFCLGFLQALAKADLLRRIDWLSTVSGGGYTGAFVGRFYDRLRGRPKVAPQMVRDALANPASPAVQWLRDHGEYIAPAGRDDLAYSFAIAIRNLLTVYLMVGLLLFGLYGLANIVRYGPLEAVGLLPYAGFSWADMPIGGLVFRGAVSVFWSPWFVVVESVLLLLALPNAIGFWLASQDEPEGYNRAALPVIGLILLAALGLSVQGGVNVRAMFIAAAIVIAFGAVEYSWWRVRMQNRAVGTGGRRVEQLRARTVLSRSLGLWLTIVAALLYFAVIDTIGHALYEIYTRENGHVATGVAQIGAAVMALVPVVRVAGTLVGNARSNRKGGGMFDVLVRLAYSPAISGILSVLLLAPPLILISYLAHSAFGGGQAGWKRGVGITVGAIVLSCFFASRRALPFINRSSLQASYAARLARAFLGASNPIRGRAQGDDVMPGDDVDTLSDYRPHEAGGPLHLINVCVNQTYDADSLRSSHGRHGVAMACSGIGVSLHRFFHGLWADTDAMKGWQARQAENATAAPCPPPGTGRRDVPQTVCVVGHVPGTPHPLLDANGRPPDELPVLPLRDWMAISGAAFGPGMGRSTSAALSLLFALANLRIGYWWDSNLTAGDRDFRPRVSLVRRLLVLLPKIFQTQTRVIAEALAHFNGPWERYWYLSDGGHFENLGVYELIRRKVPFIIAVDAGADPNYEFSDLANLQRRVRVDFEAEIEPLSLADWQDRIAKDVAASGTAKTDAAWQAVEDQLGDMVDPRGPLDDIRPVDPDNGKWAGGRHAALFRVNYRRGSSLLLYVKASMTADEPPDVEHYRTENPTFPHESTVDQFFGEAQWESYRRLGEHIGTKLFGDPQLGLWLTRLNQTSP